MSDEELIEELFRRDLLEQVGVYNKEVYRYCYGFAPATNPKPGDKRCYVLA